MLSMNYHTGTLSMVSHFVSKGLRSSLALNVLLKVIPEQRIEN